LPHCHMHREEETISGLALLSHARPMHGMRKSILIISHGEKTV